MIQIENDSIRFIFRESIAMDTDTRSSGKLCLYLVVIQHHFVISRHGFLRFVGEAGAITRFRMIGCTRIEFQFTSGRHHQNISQIRMSCTVEMRVAETYDGRVLILVAGTIFVNLCLISTIQIMRDGIRIRT